MEAFANSDRCRSSKPISSRIVYVSKNLTTIVCGKIDNNNNINNLILLNSLTNFHLLKLFINIISINLLLFRIIISINPIC